ncbi:Transposable element Tcb1 transposase [Araneus ventricosus]|uniref:Transposable element Tcb1 transposase n=1 Tax=Araneus ventricosus TaxID=182803 RepID=A0A4Y2BL88_ARAVE|nr:Transposable element Tcb1 transposase [Araneus ventricosus]
MRRLQAAELNGRCPVKKPIISTKNRKARVEWTKAHKDWTKKKWEDVLWSDESKYMLFGTDGIQWIRCPQGTRFDPKYQITTMKHGGGNVMVWGCISHLGMGLLRQIRGMKTSLRTPCVHRHAILLLVASFSNKIMIQSTDPSTSRTGSPAVM